MEVICLDTSAYSNFMRGDRKAVELVIGAGHIVVPTIVVGELRYGFRGGRHEEKNEAELREFLRSDAVAVAPVDELAAAHFADILHDLKRAGTPIPTNDVWIAAIAASTGSRVLTYDQHFDRVARVGCLILG